MSIVLVVRRNDPATLAALAPLAALPDVIVQPDRRAHAERRRGVAMRPVSRGPEAVGRRGAQRRQRERAMCFTGVVC